MSSRRASRWIFGGSSDGVMMPLPACSSVMRSMVFSSSRTLPGQP
ncbi:MAG: hypothetical protein U0168_20165 [Nannocystaceae bacterium]